MNTRSDTPLNAVQEARLADRLDALKSGLATAKAPAELELRLVDEFRRHQAHAGRAVRPRLWWMPPLAMAATVAVVSWIARSPAALPFPEPLPYAAAQSIASAEPGPFLALRSLERIALEPQARIVVTEFPRAMLAQWGMPVSPERAGEPVRAEMLYSAEGEALAVRLLN